MAATAPDTSSDALAAVKASPANADGPRRCFICLCDEDPSDPPDSWVDACPCTLTAHQDCAQSWVTDRERSNQPLECPVCKYAVQLEGPWDPLVAITDAVSQTFSRTSPALLGAGFVTGMQLCMHSYGFLSLYAFAGREAAVRFAFGAERAPLGGSSVAYVRERAGSALALTCVAPALLLGHMFPRSINTMMLPPSFLFGTWHILHDEQFQAWPPSPQLAITVFPAIRTIYYNLWRELARPYEIKLNRQLLGLPAQDPAQNENRNNNNNNGRNNQRNGEAGGIVGLLQHVIDALDADDDEDEGHNHIHHHHHHPDGPDHEVHVLNENGPGGEVVFEVVIEEAVQADVANEAEPPQEDEAAPAPDVPMAPPAADLPADAAAAAPEAVPAAPAAPQNNHEAPPAPVRRAGLGTLLSSLSDSIASTLMFPLISLVMGESLKLILPRSWTAATTSRHPGLMQQQWGRSLVGGSLYVVFRDALRLYTKHRKVAAMGQRKVKNVDRKRARR